MNDHQEHQNTGGNMQEAKHTPGPWITDGGPHVQTIYTPTDGGKPFYHTVARTDQPLVSPEQQAANSRLIAAAPDLLEALEAGQSRSWVHNAGITDDIEALRRIVLEQCNWWNNVAYPLIEKPTKAA